jgi:hypothetical protein
MCQKKRKIPYSHGTQLALHISDLIFVYKFTVSNICVTHLWKKLLGNAFYDMKFLSALAGIKAHSCTNMAIKILLSQWLR